MALFGIGKKKSKAAAATPGSVAPEVTSAATPATKKVAKAKSAAPAKPKSKGGELNIYTAVLAAAAVALAAGCVFIALDNLAGVVGTNDEGNPFAVISSR
ncbi:MAG: hypothetical protein EXS01_04170 [Phycisphaerales bacterium]|nr:hypothetical protein [Phycisphaerales bacterium]